MRLIRNTRHVLGRRALDRGDAVAVEAELQDVRGLLGAGQFGVEGLVAPGTEPRRPLDPQQEVGAPAPPMEAPPGPATEEVQSEPQVMEPPPPPLLELPPPVETPAVVIPEPPPPPPAVKQQEKPREPPPEPKKKSFWENLWGK